MHPHILASANSDPNLALTVRVLPALFVILTVSALCGRLAIMLWQPRVLGEVVGGILLGPTLFGWLLPHTQAQLFPAEVKPILYVIATVGVTLYMFLIGAGLGGHGGTTSRGRIRQAAALSISGILPSLLLGGLIGYLLWSTLSTTGISRWLFATFIGGALAITAFPVLARMLYERGLENSALGRLTLMAGAVDDVVAWCVLAVLLAIHHGNGGSAVRTIGLGILFSVVMLTVVRRLLQPLGSSTARAGELTTGAMYVVAIVPLAAGWFTDWIGIYEVFGGFVAGLVMPRDPRFREMLHNRMMGVVGTLLLPVFFTFSGLNTQLRGLGSITLLLCFLALLSAGFVGKYLGCALTMRSIGFRWREAWAVGGLMNARGLMILIFINVGLAQGIITRNVFSMLVLVTVITTAAAMPLYKLALPTSEENLVLEEEPELASA